MLLIVMKKLLHLRQSALPTWHRSLWCIRFRLVNSATKLRQIVWMVFYTTLESAATRWTIPAVALLLLATIRSFAHGPP